MKQSGSQNAQEIAARTAEALGFELVEVTLRKEVDGLGLCIYFDHEGGVTLDDCERFHKAVQPLLSEIEYDYLEVSSPGADRPIETPRDVEKNLGGKVEIKLFAKIDGQKQFTGKLERMDGTEIEISLADGSRMAFPRKAVALIRPAVELAESEE